MKDNSVEFLKLCEKVKNSFFEVSLPTMIFNAE
jgi:hypothetical protein